MESEKEMYKRVQGEIRTLFSLAVVNIVMAALALSFGVAMTVIYLVGAVEDGGAAWLAAPVMVGFAFAAAFVGFRWMLSSIGVLEGVESVKDEFDSLPRHGNGTSLTRIMVSLMAVYRWKRPLMRLMVRVSRAGGWLFAFGGFLQAMAFMVAILAGADELTIITGVVGLTVIFCLAAVCFLIPRYYGQYTKAWDERLQKGKRLEAALDEELGRSPGGEGER